MDLSTYNLVPLKTLAKRRDGRVALFVSTTTDGRFYRFISVDTRAHMNGSTEHDHSGATMGIGGAAYDIVSVSQPRVFLPGDIVRVTGMISALTIGAQIDYTKFVKDLEVKLDRPESIYHDRSRGRPPNCGEFWTFRWADDSDSGDRANEWQWTVSRKDMTFVRRSDA